MDYFDSVLLGQPGYLTGFAILGASAILLEEEAYISIRRRMGGDQDKQQWPD